MLRDQSLDRGSDGLGAEEHHEVDRDRPSADPAVEEQLQASTVGVTGILPSR